MASNASALTDINAVWFAASSIESGALEVADENELSTENVVDDTEEFGATDWDLFDDVESFEELDSDVAIELERVEVLEDDESV